MGHIPSDLMKPEFGDLPNFKKLEISIFPRELKHPTSKIFVTMTGSEYIQGLKQINQSDNVYVRVLLFFPCCLKLLRRWQTQDISDSQGINVKVPGKSAEAPFIRLFVRENIGLKIKC
jgi:hypothetical protein